jgi:hypothetical protein
VLAAAAFLLPVTTWSLKAFGYRRVERSLRRLVPLRPPPLDEDHVARATVRLVLVAAARVPVASTCLSRSLTLWALLRVRGVEGTIRFGLRRAGEEFAAHAWVDHRGQPLNEAADVGERFSTLPV